MNAIIEATTRILARKGYAGTTTNEIAERAGVSIGTLYEYFRNKDAIVRAVLDGHLDAGEALFRRRAAEVAGGGGALTGEVLLGLLVDGFIDFHADNPRLHRVLTTEVPQSVALKRRLADLEKNIVNLVEAMLVAHTARADRDWRIVAQICVQTVDSLAHRWIIDEARGPAASRALKEELTRMLAGYLELE